MNFWKAIIIVLILSFGFHAGAQRIKGEIIAGFNLAQVDGDEVYGFNKFGVNAGAGAIVPITERWSFSLETIYSEKGSKQGPQSIDSLNGSYLLRLNYLEVPFAIHFEDRDTWNFGAGLSWGRTVAFLEEEHGYKINWSKSTFPYARDDWNIFADVRFRIYKRLKFNFRYAYSLAALRTRDYTNSIGQNWSRKQYNNFMTFRLIYVFNEKIPVEKKEK